MGLYKWDVKIAWFNPSFTPSNEWEEWQVLTKTENWYEWDDGSNTEAMTQGEYDILPSTKNTDGVWRFIYE